MFSKLLDSVSLEFKLDNLLKDITAGIVIAFLQIMLSFSLASLLFSGSLAPSLAYGIGIMLFSIFIGTLISALFSSHYQIFPSMQSSMVIILVSMTTTLTIAPNKDLIATVLILISLSSLVLGIIFVCVGHFKLTQFIRYVPYPVIGGFLAGNGWLLIQGAFQLMTPFELDVSNVLVLFQAENYIVWLPGFIIAFILFFSKRLINNQLLIPVILISSVAIVYALLSMTNISFVEAEANGFVLGNIGNITWNPPEISQLASVDWSAIQKQFGNVVTLIVVALIHLALNLRGIGLIIQEDIEIDEQIYANGIMNLIIGVFGGNAAFSSTTMTTMNYNIGAVGRLVYIIAASLIFVTLFFWSSILIYVPTAVIGGLLIFLGLEFIDTWVIQGYRKFTTVEYLVALLIMLTVIFVGFLEGIFLGLFVMVFVFVGTYSRISIIYRSVSAENLSSTVERNPHFTKVIDSLGNRIHILELTGFLFFGTADGIIEHIKQHIELSTNEMEYLIIDFRRVAGVDSSALLSLNKVQLLANKHDFKVVFSDFEKNKSIVRIVEDLDIKSNLIFESDLDRALEYCESELLAVEGVTQTHIPSVIWMQLVDMGMSKEHAKRLPQYMTKRQYPPKTIIIHQGGFANILYFVEIGQVSVYLNYDSNPIRLRTLSMGTLVGEISFILERDRSATVISDMHTIIWGLEKEQLEIIRKDDPELGFAIEGLLLRMVAQRLVTSNQLLDVLR